MCYIPLRCHKITTKENILIVFKQKPLYSIKINSINIGSRQNDSKKTNKDKYVSKKTQGNNSSLNINQEKLHNNRQVLSILHIPKQDL